MQICVCANIHIIYMHTYIYIFPHSSFQHGMLRVCLSVYNIGRLEAPKNMSSIQFIYVSQSLGNLPKGAGVRKMSSFVWNSLFPAHCLWFTCDHCSFPSWLTLRRTKFTRSLNCVAWLNFAYVLQILIHIAFVPATLHAKFMFYCFPFTV